jgi:CDP-glycerol glycerophosphotransferase (TagB/SpsB family)
LKKISKLLAFIPGWIVYGLSGFSKRDKNILVFGTHTNSFAGNIKSLLLMKNPSYLKNIFIGHTKEITKIAKDFGIESYYKYSPSGIYYSLKAGIYVYSSYPSDINYWLSAGAIYTNVWHGTPLKKIERDIDIGRYSLRNKYRWIFGIIAPYQFVKPDILFVASPYEKSCFKSAFDVEDKVFLDMFPPRLVSLYQDEPIGKESKNINILYSPTWRDDHSYHIEEHLDIDKLDSFLGRYNIILYCKPHPSDQSDYSLINRSKNIKLSSKSDDIYELLGSCDILISDYSSMIFEALYLGKKVLLFCPDYNSYIENSRTFYMDPCRDLGLGENKTTDELIDTISNILKDDKYSSNLSKDLKPYNISDNIIEIIHRKAIKCMTI